MLVITTARKPSRETVKLATDLGKKYNIPFVPRGNQRLDSLIEVHSTVLLLSQERLSCHTEAGEFFLHPNMAAVRIKLLRQGKEDALLKVMGLQPGDSVLDCTAGLCADSLVVKFGVGAEGRVVALEKSLPVYVVVKHGLEHYSGPERFRELAKGIELIHADYKDYLAALPEKSFDIVYFDPMFERPVMEAAALMPLRPLAWHRPLTKTDITLAAQVARRRVVVKQRSSFDFSQLGLKPASGQNRRVGYGVLEIEEDDHA